MKTMMLNLMAALGLLVLSIPVSAQTATCGLAPLVNGSLQLTISNGKRGGLICRYTPNGTTSPTPAANNSPVCPKTVTWTYSNVNRNFELETAVLCW